MTWLHQQKTDYGQFAPIVRIVGSDNPIISKRSRRSRFCGRLSEDSLETVRPKNSEEREGTAAGEHRAIAPDGQTWYGEKYMEAAYPYRRIRRFLSQAEEAFFQALRSAAGNDVLVFAKVRLGDLVYVPKGSPRSLSWINRVRQKHADFVLCDAKNVWPFLVIELDDSSHERATQRKRDQVKNNVLAAAGIPLIRIAVQRSYSAQELKGLIEHQRTRRESDRWRRWSWPPRRRRTTSGQGRRIQTASHDLREGRGRRSDQRVRPAGGLDRHQ